MTLESFENRTVWFKVASFFRTLVIEKKIQMAKKLVRVIIVEGMFIIFVEGIARFS